MSMLDGYEILIDESFDIAPLPSEGDDSERGGARDEAIIGDKEIRVLRENRIRLAKGKTVQLHQPDGADPGLSYYVVPLICVVHSHPECRFLWSRLVVDLGATERAVIRDMSPRVVRGDVPVEIKTSFGVGLKVEVTKALSAEARPEHTTSRTVYYPEIASSGVGFSSAYWDFLSLTTDYMHSDRDLFLLFSAPVGSTVLAKFSLQAKVKYGGVLGRLLQRSGEINETYRIA